MRYLLILFGLLFTNEILCAQDSSIVRQTAAKRHHVSWQHFKITFDDDFLNIAGKGTDQYYTGGWQLDAFYRRNSGKTPVTDALLMKLHGGDHLYFYGVSRKIYTPTDIIATEIVQGDRPYASVLTLQHGLISARPETNETLTTELGLGAIGPITFGGQIQKWFHRMINDGQPMGWDNQIHNDVVIDYRINYEKQALRPAENLKLMANVDCEAGTLVDNMGAGVTLAFGRFSSVYARDAFQTLNSETAPRKLLIHVYIHPTVRAVMYNATLEGGFFSNTDPYVIMKNDINYVYLQYDLGIVMVYRRIGFSFSQKTRTAEFRTGEVHQVGSFTVSAPL